MAARSLILEPQHLLANGADIAAAADEIEGRKEGRSEGSRESFVFVVSETLIIFLNLVCMAFN